MGLVPHSPREVWLQLPANCPTPKISWPSLHIVSSRLSEAFIAGVEIHEIAGHPVKITGIDRTIVDCFKHRNLVTLEVCLEALRECLNNRNHSLQDLNRYARMMRVSRVMNPYLEKNIAASVRARLTNQAKILGNSRMKDFYDLNWFSKKMSFDGAILLQAVRATFACGGTILPKETPIALTAEFASERGKNTQWDAFLRKNKLTAAPFPEIILRLNEFLMPVIQIRSAGQTWQPLHGWEG